jgi:hypothetical protein
MIDKWLKAGVLEDGTIIVRGAFKSFKAGTDKTEIIPVASNLRSFGQYRKSRK